MSDDTHAADDGQGADRSDQRPADDRSADTDRRRFVGRIAKAAIVPAVLTAVLIHSRQAHAS